MLTLEEQIQSACNEMGLVSTEVALQQFDTDGSAIIADGVKYTAKARSHRTYQTPYGSVKINRYIYQTKNGGQIYCPLETAARIIYDATPRFAQVLSHKYSSMSASDTLNDLSMNHGRVISRKYIQSP